MFQKDYILRMIEMIGDLIAAILGLIKRGDLEQAEKMIEMGYYELLRREASFFQLIPKEHLTDKLLGDHHYTNGHLTVLAELFYAEAMVSKAYDKRDNSRVCFEKSLLLLEFLEQADKTYSEKRIERMNQIKEQLAELSKPKEA